MKIDSQDAVRRAIRMSTIQLKYSSGSSLLVLLLMTLSFSVSLLADSPALAMSISGASNSGVSNSDAPNSDAPNSARSLRAAIVKLEAASQRNGYRMHCNIWGGLSNKADHKVWMHQVYEEHQGQVRGALMYLPELSIYRNREKGAILIDEQWKPLISDPAGHRVQRIVAFPRQVLLDALSGQQKVEWIEPPESIDMNDPDAFEPMDAPLEPGEASDTAVVEKKQPSYRRVKIEVSEKVAVGYFNQIQNSGLLGGFL